METLENKEEQLQRLWKKYLTKKEIKLRDLLIEHYLYLVRSVVGRMIVVFPSYIKIDDLYSSGITGLIKAIEKFDPKRKVKFESYAILLIKGAIIDELRRLDWVPRSIHQKANQIASAEHALIQKLGRSPSDEELSHYLGLSESALVDLLHRIRPAILIPLNANINDDEEEGASISERIADGNAQLSDEIVDKKEFYALLEKAIDDLPEQEKQVLLLYYYEELMLKEIGKILGVSESRVSQIHTKALLKLRYRFKSDGPPLSRIN